MDFHRDSLLNIPNVTVFSCQEQEGYIILKLDFLNEGITCPHCHNYTDDIHQTRPILIRLQIKYKIFFLELPREKKRLVNARKIKSR